MQRFVKLGVAMAVVVLPLATACSKSNNAGTGSSSIPLPSSIPGLAGGPTTTLAKGPQPKPGRPASCDVSDQLSYAILDATSKGATMSAAEKVVANEKLDKAAVALKAALPQYASQIDANTSNAKALVEGKPSDTAPPGNEFDSWYKSTCITS